VKTDLAFPPLLNAVLAVVVLVVGVPIVYFLSKALMLRSRPMTIANPRREMTPVFLVIIAVCAGISIRALVYKLPPWLHVNAIDLLFFAFYYAILLLPVIIAMKSTGQNLGSMGINGRDMGRMVVLGLTLSAILFTVQGFIAPSVGGGFTGFSLSQAYGLMLFTMVGFSEEIVWRGYVQTRLIAYSGTIKGLVAASLLFALWHFPLRYYQFSGVALEAFASALMIFPAPSLLFGFLMLRSQNIIPPAVFHLFWDWSILFWQLPTA